MKKKSDKEDRMCMFIVLLLSRIVLPVQMPLCPLLYCCSFFASHTLYRVAFLQSSGCANINVKRLQIRNGDSDCAVGQWMMITIHI
jgi:hypothetical protein